MIEEETPKKAAKMNPKPTEEGESIFAPNVYLFAYSLRDSAEGTNNPLWKQGEKILTSFTQTQSLIDKLTFPESVTGDRADLMEEIYLSFNSDTDPKIEGFAQPQQIQDSYALWLNIGYSDKEDTAEDAPVQVLQHFNRDRLLLLPTSDIILGQTLLITGWLTRKTKQRDAEYLKTLADSCCKALLGNDAPPFYRAGELFDSAIFEYGKPSNLSNFQQVLVWLFRDENADRQYDTYQQELIALFLYRTKIVKAFHDSRDVYKNLDREYRRLETNLDSIQKQLDTTDASTSDSYLDTFKTQLKQLARDSLQYTRLLRKLEDFANTIEINLYNYNETIEQIRATLGTDKEELSFLQHFSQQTAPYFHRQIQGDLGYFEHGTELVEQAIASIRGIVEIDQAKRDRDREDREKERDRQLQEQLRTQEQTFLAALHEQDRQFQEERQKTLKAEADREKERDRKIETFIYVIGAGLTGAGIAASSSSYLTADSQNSEMTIHWIPDINRSIHPFIWVIFISIMFGVVFGGIAWLIRKLIELKKD